MVVIGWATSQLRQVQSHIFNFTISLRGINMITKDLLRALREDINAALTTVGKKHGVNLAAANASFTSDSATFKLQVAWVGKGKGGKVQSTEERTIAQAEKDWEQQAKLWGFNPKMLGKTIKSNGKTYTIKGLMPRRRAYPILAQGTDGKLTLFKTSVLGK